MYNSVMPIPVFWVILAIGLKLQGSVVPCHLTRQCPFLYKHFLQKTKWQAKKVTNHQPEIRKIYLIDATVAHY